MRVLASVPSAGAQQGQRYPALTPPAAPVEVIETTSSDCAEIFLIGHGLYSAKSFLLLQIRNSHLQAQVLRVPRRPCVFWHSSVCSQFFGHYRFSHKSRPSSGRSRTVGRTLLSILTTLSVWTLPLKSEEKPF